MGQSTLGSTQEVGVTVVENEKGALVPTRTVTGWRMWIDYRKLNATTCKDHFSLPFIDRILERVAGHPFYCSLDGYSGYYQIDIALEIRIRPLLPFHLVLMPFDICLLDCVMHQPPFRGV